MARPSIKDRLLAYCIETPSGCWEWQRARDRHGYGKLSIRCGVWRFAHRLSAATFIGPIGGLCVMHKCDNPPCINPAHLFLGPQVENVRDMINKGRMPPRPVFRGERHPCRKLSLAQVSQIKNMWRRGDVSKSELGRIFGVSRTQVGRILSGQHWRVRL